MSHGRRNETSGFVSSGDTTDPAVRFRVLRERGQVLNRECTVRGWLPPGMRFTIQDLTPFADGCQGFRQSTCRLAGILFVLLEQSAKPHAANFPSANPHEPKGPMPP